ncbi:hypothetical protein DFA_10898 [Cavenderia fasciculata]|uniref:FNIP repeat-containing protein n=1 Tax=Cavenderia fasciculata TaxID=261658 RepID=F4QBQ2_CACFS|nr:uncharacterized protein DFA_10898 [Cavenderia fasciculata]EGG14640.1 hypothetical protein DFA_10898 [Cavenderia fasciculata]|eukprot:XP_004351148.1 hypothetical protein DFA_10898 [Cavenderia fasciculata]
MESTDNTITSNRKGGVCRICCQKIIHDDDNDNVTQHQQLMNNHYLDCIDSFKQSILLNIDNDKDHHHHHHFHDFQQDNIYNTTKKRKKIDVSSSSSSSTTTTTNHFYSLFRVSMISILQREDHNQSVMNLLMTCKDAIKWKDTVVFPRLPSIDTITSYKSNERIDQIPKRYNRVYIKSVRDLIYFKENEDGLINHHCKQFISLIEDPIPPGLIPDHFTKIKVGGPIEVGSIPPFTTHLALGAVRQEMKKQLFPDTLELLSIPNGVVCNHCSDTDDLLPHNIKILFIPSTLVHPYLFNLKQLYCLTIIKDNKVKEDQDDDDDDDMNSTTKDDPDVCIGSLPNTIEHLYLDDCIVEMGSDRSSSSHTIPSSVRYLSINLSVNSPQCIPPSSVQYLYLKCDQPTTLLEGSIPSTVKDLQLDGDFTLSDRCIPPSITTLTLIDFEETPLVSVLPPSISILFISGFKCRFDARLLPPNNNIKYFGIYGEYDFYLKSSMPPSTIYFDYQPYGLNISLKLLPNDIPNGVTHIKLGKLIYDIY